MTSRDREVALALELAALARPIVLKHYRTALTVDAKADLSAEMTEDEPPSLIVTYKGEETVIELTESPADRYLVLRGLNVVLEGDYELRVFNVTLETDTHAFLVKPVAPVG